LTAFTGRKWGKKKNEEFSGSRKNENPPKGHLTLLEFGREGNVLRGYTGRRGASFRLLGRNCWTPKNGTRCGNEDEGGGKYMRTGQVKVASLKARSDDTAWGETCAKP